MTDESEFGPDIIRVTHDDSNLVGEIAQRRKFMQTLGLAGACKLCVSSGLNLQLSWLELRSYFNVTYAEFETAFRQANER